MDLIRSKVCIPLPCLVQLKFEFEFVYDHNNGFHMLMIYLIEPDKKYKGGRTHTLTPTTTGSKCSQNDANNQSDYQSHNALGPPKVPSLQALGLS